jgi:hypothetical protein
MRNRAAKDLYAALMYYRSVAHKLSDRELLEELAEAERDEENPEWLLVLQREAQVREAMVRQDGRVVRDGAW